MYHRGVVFNKFVYLLVCLLVLVTIPRSVTRFVVSLTSSKSMIGHSSCSFASGLTDATIPSQSKRCTLYRRNE